MSQNHLEHFPQKGVQRLASANPIPPIPLPCARRSSAPGHVQAHARVLVAPPLLVMSKRTCRRNRVFRKQPLAVSTGSASATVLVVPRPPSLAGWGEDEDGKPGVIVQSKPPKQA